MFNYSSGLRKKQQCGLNKQDRSRWAEKKRFGRVMAARLNSVKKNKRAARIACCADVIQSEACTDCGSRVIKSVAFCRDRLCSICSWRRSRVLGQKLFMAVTEARERLPLARYVLLTLTVRNCAWDDLGRTIKSIMSAWALVSKRAFFKNAVIGSCRTLEITRGRDGLAHPHLHVLLQVRPGYFAKGSTVYVQQRDWVAEWQSALGATYAPSVDIRAITPGKMAGAMAEVTKYLGKGSLVDGLSDAEFAAYVAAINGVRAWSCAGNLKVTEEQVEADLLVSHDPGDMGEQKPCNCAHCGGSMVPIVEVWSAEAGTYIMEDDAAAPPPRGLARPSPGAAVAEHTGAQKNAPQIYIYGSVQGGIVINA